MDRGGGPYGVAADNGADNGGAGQPARLSSEELLGKHGASSAREFCCTFWGTKWDASDVDLDHADGDGEAVYQFQTAWGPPLDWAAAAARRHPELNLVLWWVRGGGRACGGGRRSYTAAGSAWLRLRVPAWARAPVWAWARMLAQAGDGAGAGACAGVGACACAAVGTGTGAGAGTGVCSGLVAGLSRVRHLCRCAGTKKPAATLPASARGKMAKSRPVPVPAPAPSSASPRQPAPARASPRPVRASPHQLAPCPPTLG